MTSDDEWAVAAAGWDDEPAVRAYAAAAFASLTSILSKREVALDGARVCDFGCGTGLLTERLAAAGATVDAIDTSPAMLDVLRSKVARVPPPDVAVLEELPAGPARYDLVVCSSVCAFLPDYAGTVTELVALLGPGGVFVQWDWERSDDEPAGHGLTRTEIATTLATTGLADVTVDVGFTVEIDGHAMSPLVGHGRRRVDA